MLRLYDYLSSGNGYKCRLLLHQLGIPYQRIELDILAGQTRTPEFLAKNPNGRIPALELEDGTVLAESDAILFYLAEGTPFLPADRLQRAQVLQWLFFEQYSHEPFIAVARFILHLMPEDTPRRAELPRLHQGGHAALSVLEQRLLAHPFLVADRYTIADIALYA
jgi:glutathione S-transferase